MPVIDLCQKREVVGSVLVEQVVLDYNQLELFHVEAGVHLDCAFINQIYD